jgi:hypothetical protein
MTDTIKSMDSPPACDACGEKLVNVVQIPPQSEKTMLLCKNLDCSQIGVHIDWKPYTKEE